MTKKPHNHRIMRLFYLHICNNLSDPKAEQIADNGRRLGSFRVRVRFGACYALGSDFTFDKV